VSYVLAMRGWGIAALIALALGWSSRAIGDELSDALSVLQSSPENDREASELEQVRVAVRLYLTSQDPNDTDVLRAATRIVQSEPNLKKAKTHLRRISRNSKYNVAKIYFLKLVRERLSYIPDIKAAMRAAAKEVQATQVGASSHSARGPPCAENASCYGDPSELTGQPKTVQVHGYYRKDGTYVRGHYRSRPRH
jgi:hypothetical protein